MTSHVHIFKPHLFIYGLRRSASAPSNSWLYVFQNMWYPFPMLMPLSLSPEPQRPSDISQTPYASGMIQMHMVPCDQRFFQNAMNGLAGKSEGRAFKDAVCRNRAAIFWLQKF